MIARAFYFILMRHAGVSKQNGDFVPSSPLAKKGSLEIPRNCKRVCKAGERPPLRIDLITLACLQASGAPNRKRSGTAGATVWAKDPIRFSLQVAASIDSDRHHTARNKTRR